MTTLKFSSIIIGEDSEYTKGFQPSGKRKVILLGTSIMIPVILWFITGFLTANAIMNQSLTVSLITGLFTAFIVFLIERAIILSNGGWQIFIFRIFLGLIVACLGAITLDSVIFKNDIDNKVIHYQNIHLDSVYKNLTIKYENEINDRQKLLNLSQVDLKIAEKNHKDEMQGTIGNSSGVPGDGDIADELKEIINTKQKKSLELEIGLDKLKTTVDVKINDELKTAKAYFNTNGLLIRIKALHELIEEDQNLKKVYWLFTAFIFCLEFIVIIAKTGSKKSIDEEIELFRDTAKSIKLQQYMALLNRTDQSIDTLPQIINANKLLNKW